MRAHYAVTISICSYAYGFQPERSESAIETWRFRLSPPPPSLLNHCMVWQEETDFSDSFVERSCSWNYLAVKIKVSRSIELLEIAGIRDTIVS